MIFVAVLGYFGYIEKRRMNIYSMVFVMIMLKRLGGTFLVLDGGNCLCHELS